MGGGTVNNDAFNVDELLQTIKENSIKDMFAHVRGYLAKNKLMLDVRYVGDLLIQHMLMLSVAMFELIL